MTLLEALEDIGKGRIIDNGCEYELIALGKGFYTFTIGANEKIFYINLDGTPKENAYEISKKYLEYCIENRIEYNRITKAKFVKKI